MRRPTLLPSISATERTSLSAPMARSARTSRTRLAVKRIRGGPKLWVTLEPSRLLVMLTATLSRITITTPGSLSPSLGWLPTTAKQATQSLDRQRLCRSRSTLRKAAPSLNPPPMPLQHPRRRQPAQPMHNLPPLALHSIYLTRSRHRQT